MQKVTLIFVFLLVITSCTSLKDKSVKNFTLKKLPNWTYHNDHNVFSYTPNNLMIVADEYIHNRVSAFKFNKPTNKDLKTYITDSYESRNYTSNLKMYTAETIYGNSIVLTYDLNYTDGISKSITQYYKYKNHVYYVSYTAKEQYFDTYYDDAIAIMKTFTITE
jgi:hypothetical protein